MKCPTCGRVKTVMELYQVWYCTWCKKAFDGKGDLDIEKEDAMWLDWGDSMQHGRAFIAGHPVRYP